MIVALADLLSLPHYFTFPSANIGPTGFVLALPTTTEVSISFHGRSQQQQQGVDGGITNSTLWRDVDAQYILVSVVLGGSTLLPPRLHLLLGPERDREHTVTHVDPNILVSGLVGTEWGGGATARPLDMSQ